MIELIEYDDGAITMENLGKRIKDMRLDADMSQMDLSTKAGVAPYTCFHIEKGRNTGIQTLLLVLDALDHELVIRRKIC